MCRVGRSGAVSICSAIAGSAPRALGRGAHPGRRPASTHRDVARRGWFRIRARVAVGGSGARGFCSGRIGMSGLRGRQLRSGTHELARPSWRGRAALGLPVVSRCGRDRACPSGDGQTRGEQQPTPGIELDHNGRRERGGGVERDWPGHLDTLCCGTLSGIELLREAGTALAAGRSLRPGESTVEQPSWPQPRPPPATTAGTRQPTLQSRIVPRARRSRLYAFAGDRPLAALTF